MAFPPIKKTFEGLLENLSWRLTSVERRLAIGGSTGGGGGGGGDAVFAAGTLAAWSGTPSTVPPGWLLCDGRAMSRTIYPYLFAAIGTTYGAGDGSTTFNLPNGKGRVVVGQDGTQVEFDTVGETGGSKTTDLEAGGAFAKLSLSTADSKWYIARKSGAAAWNRELSVPAGATGATGTDGGGTVVGGTVPNMPPYITQNWIISTGAGSVNPAGAVVPEQLWQEFTLAKPGGFRPIVGGAVVWDGPVTGTLGAVLGADKATITLPSAGTYRILSHLGLGANPGTGTSSRLYLAGAELPKSVSYGNSGAAGVFVPDVEVFVTVTGATSFTQGAVAPLGMYDWTWLRIEKVEPFLPQSAITVNQGTTAERDAIYGVPANATEQVSLANRQIVWFNTTDGWHESYYVATGTAGLTARGLVTGTASGWYPTGRGPSAMLIGNGPQAQVANNAYSQWIWSYRHGGAAWFDLFNNNTTLRAKRAGRYRFSGSMAAPNGSGTVVASWRGNIVGGAMQFPVVLQTNYGQIIQYEYPNLVLQPDWGLYFSTDVGSWTVGGGATHPGMFFGFEYLEPLLVTD